ncbi:MAG: nucleotidyltransferase domain-containing protein [Candidatus Hodarchaeaceae archaeon]|nr:nucleotidyltransferase domain-containing protein [Candidatus Hodarchaeaceae archaeon]
MSLEEKIKELLGRERHIELAYLFGSAARGKISKLSDVDVAVYLDESLSSDERFKLQLRLMGELASLLRTGKIDLVVMNDAPPVLNYEIIRFEPIYVRDTSKKVRVEHSIMSRYLDRRYYEKRMLETFLRRVSEKGLDW